MEIQKAAMKKSHARLHVSVASPCVCVCVCVCVCGVLNECAHIVMRRVCECTWAQVFARCVYCPPSSAA